MEVLHTLSLGDLLREHRRSNPQQTALVCGDARLTYPEMDARVSRLANGLRAQGFRTGDRILWLGHNSHRVLEGLLAAAKLPGDGKQVGSHRASFPTNPAGARVGLRSPAA